MWILRDLECYDCGNQFEDFFQNKEELKDITARRCPHCLSIAVYKIKVKRDKTIPGTDQPQHSTWGVK